MYFAACRFPGVPGFRPCRAGLARYSTWALRRRPRSLVTGSVVGSTSVMAGSWLVRGRDGRRRIGRCGRRRRRSMAEGSALLGGRIGDDAVALAAFVAFRQVLRDGQPILPNEQQAVAVLVDLHLVAGADPAT